MFRFYAVTNTAILLCTLFAPRWSDAQKIDYRGLPQWSEHQVNNNYIVLVSKK